MGAVGNSGFVDGRDHRFCLIPGVGFRRQVLYGPLVCHLTHS